MLDLSNAFRKIVTQLSLKLRHHRKKEWTVSSADGGYAPHKHGKLHEEARTRLAAQPCESWLRIFYRLAGQFPKNVLRLYKT